MTHLRVGVVGAGLIAGIHVDAYTATPGAEVVAVADQVSEKAHQLAARVGATPVPDLARMLDLGLDAVSICTPPRSHAELTVTALEAGLSVLCEKPIARTLDDGRRMLAAAGVAPGLLMIGHVSRFDPDHRKAKDVIDAGQLGEVTMMSHSMTTSMPEWSEGDWLSDPELSGGPVVDLAIHAFDFLAWVAGSVPIRVHAVGRDTASGPTTYALATVRYASGALSLVETSWGHPASRGFKLAVELIGTGGRLSWDYDQISGGALHRQQVPSTWFSPIGERGYRAEIARFVEAARAGGPSPVPASEALTSLRTSLATLESVRSGKVIDLTTWGIR